MDGMPRWTVRRGCPDGINGLGDLAPVGFAELAEVVLGPPDELPQPRDFLV